MLEAVHECASASARWGSCIACSQEVPRLVREEQGASHRKRVGPQEKRLYFTRHAIDKYRIEMRHGIGFYRALRELIAMHARIHFVKRLDSGLESWRGPTPMRLRFRVDQGAGGLMQVVTVLQAADNMEKRKCLNDPQLKP